MYTPVKEKFLSPPRSPLPPLSPRLYNKARRAVPRHTKAYLWLTFLVFVFGSMILMDNGISLFGVLPSFGQQRHHLHSVDTTGGTGFESDTDRADAGGHLQSITPISYSEPISTSTLTSEIAMSTSARLHGAHANDNSHTAPSQSSFTKQTLFYGNKKTGFTPDDVVILFKTGATALWRRVPIHLTTTLANSTMTPNIAFYSDNADNIAGHPIVDVLANVSQSLKSGPDFELYRSLQNISSQNLYLESASMDGDHYLPGGWRLDKYKFLPLMQHAAKQYPDKKWYIYMEDDNYYFWHSLYNWLSTFNPAEPLVLGSPAARLGEDFAHGGSGFIVSGAAMEATFGSHPHLADEWEDYARDHCCGDQALSHVMASLGVARDRRYDHTAWMGLQALPTWRMQFGDWNWCSPLFNVHKTHSADVSRLHVLEKRFQAEHGENKIMRWRDIYERIVAPTLHEEQRVEWDNEAAEKWYSSKEDDQSMSEKERKEQPWYSAHACKKACDDWHMCLSWKYSDDNCGMSSTFAAGHKIDAGNRMDSGFMLERIEKLRTKKCEALEYGSPETASEL